MASRGGRLRSGDVLEIEAAGNFVYVQYVGKRELFGDTVLVCPVLHEQRREPRAELFGDGYFAFYPATTAARQGLACVIGNVPAPAVPTQVRRAASRSAGRGIESWAIDDDVTGRTVKATLSAEELRLPEGSIGNHLHLIRRVAEGWSPSREGQAPRMIRAVVDDLLQRVSQQFAAPQKASAAATAQATRAATPGVPTILHYLYVPGREDAAAVAQRLRGHGYRTEERRSADGDNWLVLARSDVDPARAEQARDLLETLAGEVGGEYDGWEIDTARGDPRGGRN